MSVMINFLPDLRGICSKERRATRLHLLAVLVALLPALYVGLWAVGVLMGVFYLWAAMVVFAFPFLLIRATAAWLCRGHWNLRWVRLAVDAGLAGLLCLIMSSPVADLDPRLGSQVGQQWDKAEAWKHKNLMDAKEHLVSAQQELWFFEHLPLYVLLPAALVLLGGMTWERSRGTKKRAS